MRLRSLPFLQDRPRAGYDELVAGIPLFGVNVCHKSSICLGVHDRLMWVSEFFLHYVAELLCVRRAVVLIVVELDCVDPQLVEFGRRWVACKPVHNIWPVLLW